MTHAKIDQIYVLSLIQTLDQLGFISAASDRKFKLTMNKPCM